MADATRRLAREYELIYILKPSVSPAEARKVSDRILDVVEKQGAKLTRVDNWGKRRLAYPIQRHTRGVFVYVKLVGFDGLVAEIERNLRILDDVVRYQTIVIEKVDDVSGLTVDPEEVAFRDIEMTEDVDDEPSFEERLGMRGRRDRDEVPEEAESDADDDEEVAVAGAETEGEAERVSDVGVSEEEGDDDA